MRYVTFFLTKSLKSSLLYTFSTSQLGPTKFQVLVVTILKNRALGPPYSSVVPRPAAMYHLEI